MTFVQLHVISVMPYNYSIAIQCPALSDPENGACTTTGTGVGDTATYTCNSGFEISGSDTRTCQSNGDWSGSAPTCEGKYSILQVLIVNSSCPMSCFV